MISEAELLGAGTGIYTHIVETSVQVCTANNDRGFMCVLSVQTSVQEVCRAVILSKISGLVRIREGGLVFLSRVRNLVTLDCLE